MKKYKIFKNFINDEECNILSRWIINNKDNVFFKDANMKGKRLTTRYSDNFIFPSLCYKIQDRIITTLKLENSHLANFKDGMVASYAEPGDTCYIHKDPIWKENTITLHSNIKLSNNKGGEPIIEGEKIRLNKKDMWTYPVSNVNHGSDMVLGKAPRIMWVFGFSINQKTYQSIFN